MSDSPTRVRRRVTASIASRVLDGLAPSEPGAPGTFAIRLSLGLALTVVAIGATALTGQTTTKQWMTFGLCFGVFLPAAVVGGGHTARAIAAQHGTATVPAAAGLVAAGILGTVLAARLAHALQAPAGPVLVVGASTWTLAMAVGVRRAAPRAGMAARLTGRTGAIWVVMAALTTLSVVTLVPARLLRPGPLALSLLIAGTLLVLLVRSPTRRRRRGLSLALDAGALGLIGLTVMDVSIYLQLLPYDPHWVLGHAGVLPPSAFAWAQQVHQDFYLAPVNDLLHGRPMLLDTYSQYGNGVFYFLAAWFKVAPLGYGPLGLLAGALTALQYGLAYTTLRIAGCRPAVAILATTAAVVATVFGAVGSIAQFPSTGGLRYVWAYLLILIAACRARWPGCARKARAAQLAILGVSAMWSIEAMVYGLAAFAATSGFEAVTSADSARSPWRRLAADLILALLCCIAANLLLGVITLGSDGRWPDWGPYLALFAVYSGPHAGITTTPLIPAWSAGFGVAAVYFASALGLVTALVHRPQVTDQRRATFVAVTACTTFGIVALTYWVRQADPNTIRPVALPAIMVVALWLTLLGSPTRMSSLSRVGVLAFGLWLGALVVIFAWRDAETKWHRTALYHSLPGKPGLRYDLQRLWTSPRIDPRTAEAETLLARYMPGHGPVLVLTEPDLAVETLVRTRRANGFGTGDLLEDDLMRNSVLPRVKRTIDRLRPGALMLTQLQPDARVQLLQQPTPLQRGIMTSLRRRFDLQVVETSPSRLSIVRLVRRVSRPPPRNGR